MFIDARVTGYGRLLDNYAVAICILRQWTLNYRLQTNLSFRLCFLLAVGVFQVACSAPEPTSRTAERIVPLWELDFDSETNRLSARGYIFDSQPFGDRSNAIRIIGGDRLQIASDSSTWILFRRESVFEYNRAIDLPLDANFIEAQFITVDNRLEPTFVTVNHSALPIVSFVQESTAVSAFQSLDFSWQYSTEVTIAGSEVTNQELLFTLETCGQELLNQPVLRTSVPTNMLAISLPASDLTWFLPDDAVICEFSARLLSTWTLEDGGFTSYTSRSRKARFSLMRAE